MPSSCRRDRIRRLSLRRAHCFSATPCRCRVRRLSKRCLRPSRPRLQLIGNIQRELSRKGFYDGPADGIWGAKTDTAARDFVSAAGLKISPDANDGLLRAIVAFTPKSTIVPAPANPPPDPIAKLIAPSKKVMAVQRALADFGYGQIRPTGVLDPETRAAVEKFERDRRMPVTGQISDRFVRELAGMTGRPLE